MKTDDRKDSISRVADELTGCQVLVASLRVQRPRSGGNSTCPFCPGAESMTPPTLWQDVDPQTKNWRIRVFENRFPILSGDPASEAYGIHEVIVETPRHDARLEDLTLREISRVLKAVKTRMEFHKDNPRLRVLFAFTNQGAKGGASLAHPHSQLVGLSWVPERLAAEVQGFMSAAETGTCPLCMQPTDPLIILEEDSMRAFSPRVPRFPRETWIAPVHHEPSFMDLKDGWLDDLASLLKKILSALSEVFVSGRTPEKAGVPGVGMDYNLVLHSEPLDDDSGTFHTHLEILPRLENIAGFEIGSGAMVNPVSALDAATDLREALLRADLTEGG